MASGESVASKHFFSSCSLQNWMRNECLHELERFWNNDKTMYFYNWKAEKQGNLEKRLYFYGWLENILTGFLKRAKDKNYAKVLGREAVIGKNRIFTDLKAASCISKIDTICHPHLVWDWQSKQLKDVKKIWGWFKVMHIVNIGIVGTTQEKKFQTEH